VTKKSEFDLNRPVERREAKLIFSYFNDELWGIKPDRSTAFTGNTIMVFNPLCWLDDTRAAIRAGDSDNCI